MKESSGVCCAIYFNSHFIIDLNTIDLHFNTDKDRQNARNEHYRIEDLKIKMQMHKSSECRKMFKQNERTLYPTSTRYFFI